MPAQIYPNLGLKAGYDEHENGWADDMTENIRKLSVLTQGGVSEKVAVEPTTPAEGDVVLLDETNATNPNAVAAYIGAEWHYWVPQEGWLIYNRGADYYEKFDGTVWSELATGGGGGGDGVEEAPIDGVGYVRKNGAWEPESEGGGVGGSGEGVFASAMIQYYSTLSGLPGAVVGQAFTAYADVDMTGAVVAVNSGAGARTYTLFIAEATVTADGTGQTLPVSAGCVVLGDVLATKNFTTASGNTQFQHVFFDSAVEIEEGKSYCIGVIRVDGTTTDPSYVGYSTSEVKTYGFPSKVYSRLAYFTTRSLAGASNAGVDGGSAYAICVSPFGKTAGGGGGTGVVSHDLPVTNAGGELGTMDGWTVTPAGSMVVTTNYGGGSPRSGTYFFAAAAGARSAMSQEIDVSDYADAIDARTVEMDASVYTQTTYTISERSEFLVEVLDAAGDVLAEYRDQISGVGTMVQFRWNRLSAREWLPAGARALRVTATSVRLDGTNNDNSFDDFSVALRVYGSGGGGGGGASEIGAHRYWMLKDWTNTQGTADPVVGGAALALRETVGGAALAVSSITATDTLSGYPAANLIDGNAATFWVAQYSSNPALVVDLGVPKAVAELAWTGRPDNPYWNQSPRGVNLFFSDDGLTWNLAGPVLFPAQTGAGQTTTGQPPSTVPSPAPSSTVRSAVATVADAASSLLASLEGKYIRFTATSAKTLTVQPDSTAPQADNAEWHIRNAAASNLTIVAGSGVTVNAPYGGTLIVPPQATVTLKRVAANTYDLMGQTT